MKIKLGECFGGSGNNPNLRTFGVFFGCDLCGKIGMVAWDVFFFGRLLDKRDGSLYRSTCPGFWQVWQVLNDFEREKSPPTQVRVVTFLK